MNEAQEYWLGLGNLKKKDLTLKELNLLKWLYNADQGKWELRKRTEHSFKCLGLWEKLIAWGQEEGGIKGGDILEGYSADLEERKRQEAGVRKGY